MANPGKLDKSRRFVNSVMATFVQGFNGAMIEHPLIKHDSPGASFIKEGVKLLLNFCVRRKDENGVHPKYLHLFQINQTVRTHNSPQ